MEKTGARQRLRWLHEQAAKHTTLDSIRQRIAHEEKQIRILSGAGVTHGPLEEALKAHHELIRVLTKRLADFRED